MYTKTAAPKGVKNKALWNKIEKKMMESDKYKGDQLFRAVSAAYKKAGGTYTHKSKKASTEALLIVAKKIETRLNKKANNTFDIEDGGAIDVFQSHDHRFIMLGVKDMVIRLTQKEAARLAKELSEESLKMVNRTLESNDALDYDYKKDEVENEYYDPEEGDEDSLYNQILKRWGKHPPIKVLLKLLEMHDNKGYEKDGKIVAIEPNGDIAEILEPNLKSIMSFLGY